MAVDPKHLGVDGVGAPPITLATLGIIEGDAAANAFGSLPTIVIAAPSALVTVGVDGDAGAGGFFVVGYADLPRVPVPRMPANVGASLPEIRVTPPTAMVSVGVALSAGLPAIKRVRPRDPARAAIAARLLARTAWRVVSHDAGRRFRRTG